jgi:hypothetical protein
MGAPREVLAGLLAASILPGAPIFVFVIFTLRQFDDAFALRRGWRRWSAGTNGPFALVYGRLIVADGLCDFPHKLPAMLAGRGLAVRSSRPKTFPCRSGSIHSAFRECDSLLAFAPQSITRELKSRLLNRRDLVFAGIGRGGG